MASPRPQAAAAVRVGLSLDETADSLSQLGPALDALEPFGLDSVEIFLPSMGVVVGGRIRAAQRAELRLLCADRPFAITAHGALSVNLGDPATAALQRDVVRASLEVCGEIGAGLLVQHALHCPDEGAAVERALDCEREALAALGDAAAGAGVALSIETMFADPGRWTATPAELAAQLRAVGHPSVGACFDFAHSWLNRALRPFDFLAEARVLAPLCNHMHIHDNFGRPKLFRPWSQGDALMLGFGDVHLPPGAGTLPWADLARLPFAGAPVANLELDRRWAAEWAEAVAWTRAWAGATGAAAPVCGDGQARL